MSHSSKSRRESRKGEETSQDAFFNKQPGKNKQGGDKPFFQAKMKVNKPGDKFEKEADSVADSVVHGSSPGQLGGQSKAGGIQKLSTPSEDEKLGTNDARMMKDKEIQEKPIQKKGMEPEKEKQKKKA